MKCEAEIRELLINNTIRLVAEGGFEKATVKEISHSGGSVPGVKPNDVYIYRLFGSKENLYRAAFARLDGEVIDEFRKQYAAVGGFNVEGRERRERLYSFFLRMWEFFLSEEQSCRYYVRYYYSIYFKGHSSAEHKRIFTSLIEGIKPIFKEEADVEAILHSMFTSLLDFVIRVYNGELENSDVNIPHVFRVLYCMAATYFKDFDAEYLE